MEKCVTIAELEAQLSDYLVLLTFDNINHTLTNVHITTC
jgi:hypothetical protein